MRARSERKPLRRLQVSARDLAYRRRHRARARRLFERPQHIAVAAPGGEEKAVRIGAKVDKPAARKRARFVKPAPSRHPQNRARRIAAPPQGEREGKQKARRRGNFATACGHDLMHRCGWQIAQCAIKRRFAQRQGTLRCRR